jgi:hypothetical protein
MTVALSSESEAATSSQWSQAASRVGILISGIPNPVSSSVGTVEYGKWGIGIINPLDRDVKIYSVGIMSEVDNIMDKIIAKEPSSGWTIRDLGVHDVVIWEGGSTPITIPQKSVGQFRVEIDLKQSALYESGYTVQALTSEGKLSTTYTVLSSGTLFPLINTFYTNNTAAPATNWTFIIENIKSSTNNQIFNATIQNGGSTMLSGVTLLILVPADFTNIQDVSDGSGGWNDAAIDQNPDGSHIITVSTTLSSFIGGDIKTYQFSADIPTVSDDKLYVFQTTAIYPLFTGAGKSQLASSLSEAGVEIVP